MCYYMLSSQGDIALVFSIISVFMTVRAAAHLLILSGNNSSRNRYVNTKQVMRNSCQSVIPHTCVWEEQ